MTASAHAIGLATLRAAAVARTDTVTSRRHSATSSQRVAQATVGVQAWVVTPDALLADLEQTNAYLMALNTDIIGASHRLPRPFVEGWIAFINGWIAFYFRARSFWERLWSSTNAVLEDYKRQGREWRQRFITEGGRPSTPEQIPDPNATPLTDRLSAWRTPLIVGAVAAGIVGLVFLTRSIKG